MAEFWELKVGQTRRSFKEWGFSNLKGQFVNLKPDTVTFKQVLEPNQFPTFKYGDHVQIFRNNVRWFVGTIDTRPVVEQVQSKEVVYTVKNAWHAMERVTWLFDYVTLNLAFIVGGKLQFIQWPVWDDTPYGFTPNGELVGQAPFIQSMRHEPPGPLRNALEYGAAVAGYQLGIIQAIPFAPREDFTNITVSQMVEKILSWTPDVVGFFGYESDPVKFSAIKRENLNHQIINVKDASKVVSYSVAARDDLVLEGVYIRYRIKYLSTISVGVKEEPGFLVESVGLAPPHPRVLVLQDIPQETAILIKALQPNLPSIAQQIYDSRKTLGHEGHLTIVEQECSGTLRPGVALTLMDGTTKLATKALIQETVEDIDSGITTVKFGPPEHLSPQDMITLLQRWRIFRLNGGKGNDSKTQESDESERPHETITICRDGTTMEQIDVLTFVPEEEEGEEEPPPEEP